MEMDSCMRYPAKVDSIDDAKAFLIARDLIAVHGDDVACFLEDKIDVLMESGEIEQLSSWFVIRNAVALSLKASRTLQ
jgi:hypothetical protein